MIDGLGLKKKFRRRRERGGPLRPGMNYLGSADERQGRGRARVQARRRKARSQCQAIKEEEHGRLQSERSLLEKVEVAKWRARASV